MKTTESPGLAVAKKNVADFGWVFNCHFPGDPVVPGTMILDGIFQLMGIYSQYIGFKGRGRASRTSRMQFHQEVTPSQKMIQYRVEILKVIYSSQIVICNGLAFVDGIICVSAENAILTIIKDSK